MTEDQEKKWSTTQQEIFVRRLEICENSNYPWSEFDRGFLRGIREAFDMRDEVEEFSGNPWMPSAKQWNYLMNLWEKTK